MSVARSAQDPRFISTADRPLHGVARIVPVASPPAGTDWSVSVPAGRQWRLLELTFHLVTSAVVATRGVRLDYSDGNLTFVKTGALSAVPASSAIDFAAAPGYPQSSSVAAFVATLFPLPDMWIPPSTRIFSNTNAIDVGDQYSAIVLYVEELFHSNTDLSEQHFVREDYEYAALMAATGATTQTG